MNRLPALLGALVALSLGSAQGQEPPPGEGPAGSTPTKTRAFADLAGRYRFSERYTTEDTQVGPGIVGPYRVATLEVVRDSFDSVQGAPRRVESTRQVIYSERAGVTGNTGNVVITSTRAFEKFQAKPADPRPTSPPTLEGLAVLVRPKVGELPTVLALTPGRSLAATEFGVISRQTFVPHLPALLPVQSVRLGDTWRVPRKAVQALLGEPYLQADSVTGKLAELRKEIDGPRMVASITVSGKVSGPGGESTVNAEVLFTFQAPKPRDDSAPRKPSVIPRPMDDLVEARGAITEVRLATVATGPLPGPGRLRFQSNRELTLHRQLGVTPGGLVPPLVEAMPEVTEANSWLTEVDPSGRFTFRHPQDLLPPDHTHPPSEPNTTYLVRTRREGRDMLQLEFAPKVLTPDDLKKELAAKYGALKMEVLKGEEAWLPEADWPGVRVHRIDAALKVDPTKAAAPGASTRIHFDGYLIQFAKAASLMAVATTSRETVAPFRRESEQILKSIQLDPNRPLASDPGGK